MRTRDNKRHGTKSIEQVPPPLTDPSAVALQLGSADAAGRLACSERVFGLASLCGPLRFLSETPSVSIRSCYKSSASSS